MFLLYPQTEYFKSYAVVLRDAGDDRFLRFRKRGYKVMGATTYCNDCLILYSPPNRVIAGNGILLDLSDEEYSTIFYFAKEPGEYLTFVRFASIAGNVPMYDAPKTQLPNNTSIPT